MASGSLPAGLTLSSDGVLSGTPSVDGTFTFTVKAENAVGSAAKELSISVARRLADAQTGVQILLPQEALPDGISLQDVHLDVKPVTNGTAFAQAQGALASVGTKFSLFDIRLLLGSTPLEPTQPVQVSLPIPDGFDPAHLALYYIKDNGTAEQVSGGSVQGGRYVFMASHFSGYALVDTSSKIVSSVPSSTSSVSSASSSADSTGNPPTGVETPVGAAVIVLGAAACVVLLRRRRK